MALLTDEFLVLVARNDFPADNLQQFIAYTKANQEKLHYSSSGAGGSNHLACMLLNSTIGIEVTHVPYRNVVQGLQEVMAGRMDYDCVIPVGATANWGQDRQANRDPEQDPVVEPAGSPLRARTGADQLRSPELVCTLPAREDSAADYPEAQPRHCRRARDAVLAAASQASRRRCDRTGTPLSGISRAISCRRNQEMGRPDQGEWRFILIAIDRMRFTYPCCPYPAHLARCAKRDIDELWLAPVWRQVGSFRMRRFCRLYGEVVMSLAIKNLNAPLGAEISGLDLSKPIAPNEARTIEDVWCERLVVVFHDQKLSDPQLIAFSRNFGELDPPGPNPYGEPFNKDYPEINVISNVVENGKPIGNLGAGEAVWHADMTYVEVPPKAAVLHALEVPPPGGGNTYLPTCSPPTKHCPRS